MSNLPFPWWDKTITIYNKFVDPTTQRITWYRTVIENCFWKYVNNTYHVKGSNMLFETKDVICRIPENDSFVFETEWRALSDKSEAFTLATGDIIVLGEVSDVIDEYTKGNRSTDLIAKYKEQRACLEIDTYVDNTQTGVDLGHYRVIGK